MTVRLKMIYAPGILNYCLKIENSIIDSLVRSLKPGVGLTSVGLNMKKLRLEIKVLPENRNTVSTLS